ncbi:uncharacterized protein [Palaemon carinicauda]|uniref:uncharacterized protein n=1 Tax=Palaemon carinicauda TaxID=392227 RepID=UPI0035B5BC5C
MAHRMPENIWGRGKHHPVPQKYNLQLEYILISSGIRLAEVDIRRGIFQGDSLSPLLFVVARIPMTKVLHKVDAGYQRKKRGNSINHQMFMDDIKLYGKNIKEINILIHTVMIVSGDIWMEFAIEKCALVNIQKSKVTGTKGIKLAEGSNIKHIDGTGYKYLGIMEGGDAKHQEMKDTIRKEYSQRLNEIPKSEVNGRNMIKTLSTWAVPVIRDSAGIVE